jgi:hypothetical protein
VQVLLREKALVFQVHLILSLLTILFRLRNSVLAYDALSLELIIASKELSLQYGILLNKFLHTLLIELL